MVMISFSTLSRFQPSLPRQQLKTLRDWRPSTPDWLPALNIQSRWTGQAMKPLIPGYGSISNPENPFRDRYLVPVYACNEQETSSQRHVRQLLYLAKALKRTLVLPNWGTGLPQLSPHQKYSFDQIYELDTANNQGLWNVPYPVFERYVSHETFSLPFKSR